MTEAIQAFIDAMAERGCAPARSSDIISDNKWHDIDGAGDKPKSKKVYYRFKTDEMGWVGQFGNRREGETHTAHSRAASNWTPEQRRQWEAKRKAQEQAAEQERQETQAKAAAKAAEEWKAAKPADPKHPYLVRKGISGIGLRQEYNILLIPMKDANGKIWSLQRIDADGDKIFAKGGRTEAVYHTIIAKEPLATIYIVEGFATGESVYKAMSAPVVVCFCARNLKAVGKILRAKYPDSRLIFAADNDAGKPRNTGIEKGQEAAAAVNGFCIAPQQAGDWNDVQAAEGLDGIRRQLGVIPEPKHENVTLEDLEAIPPPSEDDYRASPALLELYTPPKKQINPEWRKLLQKDHNERVKAKSLINLDLILRNHDDYQGLFIYDEFSNEKTVVRCPAWEDADRFSPHPLKDTDITGLAIDLARKGLEPGYDNVARVLNNIIKSTGRHPAREYFNSLKWDGTKRLESWLTTYCRSIDDHPDYLSAVGIKWMTAAVSRVFEPGCKFDHMIIFEGPQNAGKSLMLKELATIHKRTYFDDTIKIKDMDKPESIRKMQGVLIIEFAELSGIRDKDVNELKQALTITTDRIRALYENEPSFYPRQFIPAGTTNNTKYLHDITGNRRFWPVKVGDKIDLAGIRRDKEQLWAEAVHYHKQGEKLYLEGHLYALAETAQQRRLNRDVWHDDIESHCEGKNFVSSDDLWTLLVPARHMRTGAMQERISGVMQALGYERGRGDTIDGRMRGWIRKERLPEKEQVAWPI